MRKRRLAFSVVAVSTVRDAVGHERHKAAVVAMPAVRLGRHIGAVRLDQNAVERQSRDGLDRAAGVFEGHDTREAQIPTALGKPKRHFRRAGEAVEHAARVGMPPDDVHGVAVRLALVDDDRELQRLGQLELLLEGNDLPRARHVLIVIIQPDLADGAHARIGRQRAVAVEQTDAASSGWLPTAAYTKS